MQLIPVSSCFAWRDKDSAQNSFLIIFSDLDKRQGLKLIFDNHWTIIFSDLGVQRENYLVPNNSHGQLLTTLTKLY